MFMANILTAIKLGLFFPTAKRQWNINKEGFPKTITRTILNLGILYIDWFIRVFFSTPNNIYLIGPLPKNETIWNSELRTTWFSICYYETFYYDKK